MGARTPCAADPCLPQPSVLPWHLKFTHIHTCTHAYMHTYTHSHSFPLPFFCFPVAPCLPVLCSVDEYWHVPHFEKMMYDNPQLALTYLDAFRITLAAQKQRQQHQQAGSSAAPGAVAAADSGAALVTPAAAAAQAGAAAAAGLGVEDERLADPRVYATVVRGVLDYMRRDMTHPQGGLYSAEVRAATLAGMVAIVYHVLHVVSLCAVSCCTVLSCTFLCCIVLYCLY